MTTDNKVYFLKEETIIVLVYDTCIGRRVKYCRMSVTCTTLLQLAVLTQMSYSFIKYLHKSGSLVCRNMGLSTKY